MRVRSLSLSGRTQQLFSLALCSGVRGTADHTLTHFIHHFYSAIHNCQRCISLRWNGVFDMAVNNIFKLGAHLHVYWRRQHSILQGSFSRWLLRCLYTFSFCWKFSNEKLKKKLAAVQSARGDCESVLSLSAPVHIAHKHTATDPIVGRCVIRNEFPSPTTGDNIISHSGSA